jgi:hypothetical protein
MKIKFVTFLNPQVLCFDEQDSPSTRLLRLNWLVEILGGTLPMMVCHVSTHKMRKIRIRIEIFSFQEDLFKEFNRW